MSHVVSVDCFCTDLADLRTAAERLGFEFREGQTTHAWFGVFVGDSTPPPGRDPKLYGTCEHALRLTNHQTGDYEIGLVPRLDGEPGWELMYDQWGMYGQRLEAAGGHGLAKLKDELAAEAAMRTLRREGLRVWRTTDANGDIEINGEEY